jgi:PII-like signaling protein
LPVVVEIVDEEGKIDAFLPTLSKLFEKSGSGGLVTVEKIGVIHYSHGTI